MPVVGERTSPLPREFFARSTETVARELLGKLLCRAMPNGLSCGRIVETEAYGGPEDRASHARAGLTRRTGPMFGQVGHAYVYLVYGMHACLNVVAREDGAAAGAVLLRALEATEGVNLMRGRRGRAADHDYRLAAGPARLCQAMAVDRSLDGHDLTTGSQLWLVEPSDDIVAAQISAGARVGVDYAGKDWSARPWRFWLTDNPSVSRR